MVVMMMVKVSCILAVVKKGNYNGGDGSDEGGGGCSWSFIPW